MHLSTTQRIVLNAAAQRDDRIALPLPANLKGGAAAKVVAALVAKRLLEEVDARRGDPVWRKTGDGHGTTLAVTDAGLAAIGIAREDDSVASHSAAGANTRAPRAGTKQTQLIAMLRAPAGATIAEIVAATGWQPHTVRGAMSGALKKKLGLEVTSEKIEKRGRVYRLPAV